MGLNNSRHTEQTYKRESLEKRNEKRRGKEIRSFEIIINTRLPR